MLEMAPAVGGLGPHLGLGFSAAGVLRLCCWLGGSTLSQPCRAGEGVVLCRKGRAIWAGSRGTFWNGFHMLFKVFSGKVDWRVLERRAL